jgi:glucose-6-phosphate 1-epimerase
MNNPYINLVTTPDKVDIFNIVHPKFRAQVSRFGGHLLSFQPTGDSEWLWMSASAILNGTKPIRGGVPICWPWFGPATGEFEGEPQHGYIRNVNWVVEVVEGDDQALTLRLKPELPEQIRLKLGLDVYVEFNFSDALRINLVTTNISDVERPLSQAIHSYCRVDNVTDVSLLGLDGVLYSDKLTGQDITQAGTLAIDQSIDRVYKTKTQDLIINNKGAHLSVIGKGHDSIVVWNPWQDIAANMADFDNEGYQTMVCVEMANTQGLMLQPGKRHALKQIIRRPQP